LHSRVSVAALFDGEPRKPGFEIGREVYFHIFLNVRGRFPSVKRGLGKHRGNAEDGNTGDVYWFPPSENDRFVVTILRRFSQVKLLD
jgi:hypothetical protein